MINFIYGVSGSGKSSYIMECIARDIEADRLVYLIVPEQETYVTERRYTRTLPPSAQLSFEVVNFTRLADKAFRKYGGLSYNYVDPAMKSLLMWQNLRELAPLLEEYGSAVNTPAQTAGLASLMLAASGELKAAAVTPAVLERAADRLPRENALRPRLRDISLICAAFDGLVAESYDDSADDIGKLSELLAEHDFFAGHTVYIDSFTSYTAGEYEVIRSIMKQADGLTVTFGCDSPDTALVHFASIRDTSDRLHELASGRGGAAVVVLGPPKRFTSPDLLLLEKYLWRMEMNTVPEDEAVPAGNIEIYSCATPYSEAEAAASRILLELRRGMRCRDIAVIMRDAGTYSGIVDAVFDRYGIPYFMSERTDISNKPLIKLVLSALRIKNRGWRQGDVISHIKTGLCGFSDRETDLFEDYCSVWNINGSSFTDGDWSMNPDGFTTERSQRANEILAAANGVRARLTPPLITLFTELEAAGCVRDMCRAVYEYTERLCVREGLADLARRERAAGSARAAGETLRVYDVFIETLDKVSHALGDIDLSSEEFAAALSLVFDNTSIGSLPTRQDEVLIGSASLMRADAPRLVIVLGMNEGIFPADITDGGLLSDADRITLGSLGIKLSGDPTLRFSEELFFVYRSLTAASAAVQISFSLASASGSQRGMSPAISRLISIFPGTQIVKFERLDPLRRMQTPQTALEFCGTLTDGAAAEAVRRVLSEHGTAADRLRMLDIPVADSDGSVPLSCAAEIFGDRISLSQSKLDSYVQCGFMFFCNYVLGLREGGRAEFSSSHAGTFLHYVLEKFMAAASHGGTFYPGISDSEAEELADRIILDYADKIIPRGHERESRLTFLFGRLRRIALVLISDIREEFRNSSFIPAFCELSLDGKSELLPVSAEFPASDGTKIKLRGVVDRVDLFRREGDVYIRVVDYKSGEKTFSPADIKNGLGLQLLLYLFALCRADSPEYKRALGCAPDGRIYPAGAMYLSAKLPLITVDEDIDEEEILGMAKARLTRSGPLLADDDILRAMNAGFDSHYLAGVKKDKNHVTTGKFLKTHEDFNALYDELSETVGRIAQNMRRGLAVAKPLISGGKSPCNFCRYSRICRSAKPTGY